MELLGLLELFTLRAVCMAELLARLYREGYIRVIRVISELSRLSESIVSLPQPTRHRQTGIQRERLRPK